MYHKNYFPPLNEDKISEEENSNIGPTTFLSIVDLIHALQEHQEPIQDLEDDSMLPFKTQEFEGFRDVSNVSHNDVMETHLWNSWLL